MNKKNFNQSLAMRVVRGGSWNDFARGCRSAYRIWSRPDNRDGDLCFRAARTQESPGKAQPEAGRVLRGGSWDDAACFCRSDYRDWSPTISAYNFLGFRPARTQDSQKEAQPYAGHAIRGGSWYDGAHSCRSAFRFLDHKNHRYYAIGLRLARTQEIQEGEQPQAKRVRRGGSWDNEARFCRSAYRAWNLPDLRYDNLDSRRWISPDLRFDSLGFRPARDQDSQGEAQSYARRTIRGGSWFVFARGCRSAARHGGSPDDRISLLGFRPARTQESRASFPYQPSQEGKKT